MLFLAVFVLTAVVVTRLVGGPGAAEDCAGDECDANMAYIYPLLFAGLPTGSAAGWMATRLLRRIWR